MTWALALILALAVGADAQAQPLVVGYNQGWIDGKYGHDLTTRFNPADWARIFARAHASGGQAVRVWLFEGRTKEGVAWRGTEPVGLVPGFLDNVRTVAALAEEVGVQIYWTGLSGNWAASWGRRNGYTYRHYNLLNNRYGRAEAWRSTVLKPVLKVLRERPAVNYGYDLMNEVQGSLRFGYWPDRWAGARRFVRDEAAFVHAHAPGLKVTASVGHHTAAGDLLDGRLDGLGLDFFDVHVYTNDPQIPRGQELAAHARRNGIPIVVGEFGQRTRDVDDALQVRVTQAILSSACRYGFAGAFAWRLEDEQAGDGSHFTFWGRDDTPRPAVNVMQRYGRPRGRVGLGGQIEGLGR
jgi:hypothetical protein